VTDDAEYFGWAVKRLSTGSVKTDARYTQLALVLTRSPRERGTAMLACRVQGSRLIKAQRLGLAVVALPHGSDASVDPFAAMQASLDALREIRPV
jgi:hypothetical protein